MLAAMVIGALVASVASPYLARLTLTAPATDVHDWWRGRVVPSRARLGACAAVASVLGALAGLAAGPSLLLVPFVALALVGTPLVIIDVEHHRLPNRLVFTLAVLAPATALGVAASRDEWGSLLRATEAGVVVFAVLFVAAFVAPRAFGYGDVKLGAVLGAYPGWFGWAEVYYGIFGAFLLGALVSLLLLLTRRASLATALPFGPMLITGPLVVLASGLVPAAM